MANSIDMRVCATTLQDRESDVLINLDIAKISTNTRHMQFLHKRQHKNVWELLLLTVPEQRLNYQPPSSR